MIKTYKVSDWITEEENICVHTTHAAINDAAHTHEFAEFVYISGGKGVHTINDVAYPVKQGNLLFINYNQTHSIEVDGRQSYVNILLKPEFFNKELMNSENVYEIFSYILMEECEDKFAGLSPVVLFRGEERIEIEEIIVKMQKAFVQKKFGYKIVLKGYLNVLFTYMFRKMLGNDNLSTEYMNSIMPDVIEYINKHCMGKITLNEIATNCFYNKAYLSRTFKKYYGISPIAYIQEKRLTEAANLLSSTNLTIEKICNMVGYSEKKQFYKLFEKKFGTTPGAYRKLQ